MISFGFFRVVRHCPQFECGLDGVGARGFICPVAFFGFLLGLFSLGLEYLDLRFCSNRNVFFNAGFWLRAVLSVVLMLVGECPSEFEICAWGMRCIFNLYIDMACIHYISMSGVILLCRR